MQSAQLACPHCGSTLNFGVQIAAGSPVECLICMKSFIAASAVSPAAVPAESPTLTDADTHTITDAQPATPKKHPRKQPPAAAPTTAITASAADEPIRKSVSKHRANLPSDPEGSSNRLALIALALGAFFLLSGGVGLAVWKAVTVEKAPPGDEPVLAVNTTTEPAKKPEIKPIVVAQAKPKPADTKPEPIPDKAPPLKIDEEAERNKAKQAEAILLNRPNVKVETEPDAEEVAKIEFVIKKSAAWGLDQQKVNAAIDKGVAYLKRTQHPNGTWVVGHEVGYASIGGLTLLECGVPKTDLSVQRAAHFVRGKVANLMTTYELSLAILFLDRLGDRRDRLLIQGMALRLLAGQNDSGGWTYISRLDSKDMYPLFAFLHTNRKPTVFDQMLSGEKSFPDDLSSSKKKDPNGKDNLTHSDPFKDLSDMLLSRGMEGPTQSGTAAKGDPVKPNPGGVNPGNDPNKPINEPKMPDKKLAKGKHPKRKVVPIRPERLHRDIQTLPIVLFTGKGKHQINTKQHDRSDNSNTQFALLALWTARRHEVPTDTALLAAYNRFFHTQCSDGGWGYHPQPRNPTASMTGVGLLGLAMGHGTEPDILGVDPKDPRRVLLKPALQDPKVQAGLKAFAHHIGNPSPTEQKFPMQNLYFLWTVERVAMLYNLRTIDGKDWYGWGAQILVHNQMPDGAWPNTAYPGTTPQLNTCFALLFLKRSNLVRDLTKNLTLQTGLTTANP